MLELMARSCLRVGEVLKLTPNDILDRKLILNDTKSGKEAEVAFLPQKVADRLKKYISDTIGTSGKKQHREKLLCSLSDFLAMTRF